ncbi:MAG: YlmC/YmxH family sporulation protein [Clostridia bacterium]|nr:YlmC/YmxH family sporulation protein [Clostridia bacterium]
MNLSFCELRQKEVVNTLNGQRLGKPLDVVFCCETAVISGIVMQGEKKLFKSTENIFIPWKDITKIGEDVILVNFTVSDDHGCTPNRNDC